MASRPVRYMSHAFRTASRPASNPVFRTPARRPMSSSGQTHSTPSDTPWMIGSALVFGPALIWCLAPQSTKSKTDHHHPPVATTTTSEPVPVPTQTEENEDSSSTSTPSEADIDSSITEAVDSDSLKEKSDADSESVQSDDEGVMVSSEELNSSMEEAFVRTILPFLNYSF